jgi:hypothetical protein
VAPTHEQSSPRHDGHITNDQKLMNLEQNAAQQTTGAQSRNNADPAEGEVPHGDDI